MPRRSRSTCRVFVRSIVLAILVSAAGLVGTIAVLSTAIALAEIEAPAPTEVDPVEGGPVPADVQLHVGDTATLDNGGVKGSLVQVEEDSRCPANVTCVSAGRGLVDLRVTVDGDDKGLVTASLVPGPLGQRLPDLDAIVERYIFSLIDLQPYLQRGQSLALDQELATIHVAMHTP